MASKKNQCVFLLSGYQRIQNVFEKTQCWEHPGKEQGEKEKGHFAMTC